MAPFPGGGDAVLLTGATGFIGRRVSERLAASGEVAVCAVGRDRDRLQRLDVSQRVVADLSEAASVEVLETEFRALRPQAVLHLAGLVTSRSEDVAHGLDLIRGNVSTVAHVWQAIERTPQESRPRRVVLASSILVYGRPDYLPVSEQDVCRPADMYGATKFAAERLSFVAAAALDIELVVLRIGFVYGPDDTSGKVVYRFLDRAARDQPLQVSGGGFAFRDYVYIDDVVGVIEASPGELPPGVYNVSPGKAVSVAELARAAVRVCGSSAPVVVTDAPQQASDLFYGCIVMDSGRVSHVVGAWTPLDAGLAATLRWLSP